MDGLEKDGFSRQRISRRRAIGGIGVGLVAGILTRPAPAQAREGHNEHDDHDGDGHDGGHGPGRGLSPASPLGRRGCTVTALNGGLVLVAGGYLSSPTGAVQLYDPVGDDWFDAAPMNTPRYHHAAAVLRDGRVLVTGGQFLQVLSTAEIYDPRRDIWTLVAPMHGPRTEHGVTALDRGGVLVTGGFYRNPLSSVEVYDDNADRWFIR